MSKFFETQIVDLPQPYSAQTSLFVIESLNKKSSPSNNSFSLLTVLCNANDKHFYMIREVKFLIIFLII